MNEFNDIGISRQQDLIRLMHEPEIAYVSGGHLSTVLRTEDYIRTIRPFLAALSGSIDKQQEAKRDEI